MFARSVWLILRKDLTVEVRSGEIAYTTLFFAVSCILIFAFALVRDGRGPEDGAAGLLWIAIAFAGTLALGRTIGFASVGTLFAAMLIRARSRDVLLPVLLYPVIVPVMIAAVRGTGVLLQPEIDTEVVSFWLALLSTFDVVFVTLALWTFEPVMTD
jgi:ABC-type transport system involved in cytochrome c biogenesis permease component